jgi:16S rRNA (guanine966-N2)-methyltransferase
MRIISGQHKGRTLLVPSNFKGRPTTDFAREGLFNVLQNQVDWEGLRVLELFAGTGAFGLECASRGTEDILAVEVQHLHVEWIRRNFVHFEVPKAKVIQQDVFKFISQYSGPGFDLIFADPPFDLPLLPQLPMLVTESALMPSGGLFILEHPKEFRFETQVGFVKTKQYANVFFSFFEFPGKAT